MALFDQQQQEEEQPNQVQPYGVCVGNRRIRIVQQVPYVPDVNMGRPLFRARQLPAHPVREQQHVMLQDRINQDVQHNIRQDNIAYNRRLYDDPQVMSPNRPEEDAPMVNPLNGPQIDQRDQRFSINRIHSFSRSFISNMTLNYAIWSKAMMPRSSKLSRKFSKSSELWDICPRCSLKHSLAFEATPRIRTRICTIWPVKWSYRRLDYRKSQQRSREFHVQRWNR